MGRNRKREIAKETPKAMLQEATMPKEWKNGIKRRGNGILIREWVEH